jgi:hypothetical protein
MKNHWRGLVYLTLLSRERYEKLLERSRLPNPSFKEETLPALEKENQGYNAKKRTLKINITRKTIRLTILVEVATILIVAML